MQWQDQLLLCKRGIEPRRGKWTLPAGYLENHETLPECASREAREEACAELEQLEPYALVDIPHISQVYMFYRCDLDDGSYGVGPESLESGLYSKQDVPWDEIAFPTVHHSLRFYFADRARGRFEVHTLDLTRMPQRPRDREVTTGDPPPRPPGV